MLDVVSNVSLMVLAAHLRTARRARVAAVAASRMLLALATLLATAGDVSHAQNRDSASSPSAEHIVLGTVRAADESRLLGAHVTLLVRDPAPGGNVEVVTDADGAFRFEHVADGAAHLAVRRLGFRPETLSVEVPQLAGGGVAVLLERVARPLAPVLVREAGARRAGRLPSAFERRRTAGFGHFLTRADVERRSPQRTSDLFRSLPSITMTADANGVVTPQFRSTGRVARCDPAYWIDGMPLGTGTPDLDAISPNSIEAIELYSGSATVPSALRGTSAAGGCGVIAIWTRQGEAQADELATTAAADSLDGMVARGWAFTADQVELAAAPLPGLGPTPAYPDSLRAAKIGGRVVAEFVVDGQGKVDADAIGIVSSTHPLFSDAVRAAVVSARFSPAYREGHVVRQVVHLPVVFEPGGQGLSPAAGTPDRRQD